jgi:hypothetical protein
VVTRLRRVCFPVGSTFFALLSATVPAPFRGARLCAVAHFTAPTPRLKSRSLPGAQVTKSLGHGPGQAEAHAADPVVGRDDVTDRRPAVPGGEVPGAAPYYAVRA